KNTFMEINFHPIDRSSVQHVGSQQREIQLKDSVWCLRGTAEEQTLRERERERERERDGKAKLNCGMKELEVGGNSEFIVENSEDLICGWQNENVWAELNNWSR
ncbi:hypothetical protein ACJX0J_038843, partial [Zea mays]